MPGTRPYNLSFYPDQEVLDKFYQAIEKRKAAQGERPVVEHGDKKRFLELAMNRWADEVLAEESK
jgi:hypothetical protein